MPDRLYSQRVAELIGYSLDLVPPRIQDRIGGVRFHEGVYGRAWGGVLPDCYVESYRANRFSFYSCPLVHQGGMVRAQREPTIGLNPVITPGTVLHELGHALWFSILEPHKRWRCFWDPGRARVYTHWSNGLVPSMLAFTSYNPASALEQFAEAFALWLTPPVSPTRREVDGRAFYKASRTWTVDHWGRRFDNRQLLAWLNELAGWPWDLPPRGLRDGAAGT